MNILVSCAGGPAAVGAIKSIRDLGQKHVITAIDCDALSVGFYLADRSYRVPFSVEDKFWPQVLKIIRKEKIDLILPTGDADIVHFSKNKKMLEKLGVTVFMSDFKSINYCQDKLKFYIKGKKSEISEYFPKTSTNHTDIDFPILCKPRKGSGSRGIKLWESVDDVEDLSLIQNLHISDDYLFQEHLPGTEYTIDVLCDLNSNPLSIIPRERLQIKAGISSKGKIIKNEIIEEACKKICKLFEVKGPVCIQMKDDVNGIPKFVEMNPRLGGGTYFTTLSGVNFIEIILQIMKGEKPKVNNHNLITVLRFYNEVVI